MKLQKSDQLYLLGIFLSGIAWSYLERPYGMEEINISYLLGTSFGFFIGVFFLGAIIYYLVRIVRKSLKRRSFLQAGIQYGFYVGLVFLIASVIDKFM